MKAPPQEIFKAYDIRGIVNETLTADGVKLIGQALGSEAPLVQAWLAEPQTAGAPEPAPQLSPQARAWLTGNPAKGKAHG